MAGGSRFQQKQQKRRQNGVLNIAIAIVLLLVAIVAYQLFVPSTKEQASSTDKKVSQQTTKNEKAGKSEDKESAKKKEKEQAEAKQKAEEEKLKAEEEKKKAEEEAKANEKVSAEKTVSKAKEAYTKPSWKAVGTEQGSSPAMTFKQGSSDWNEMQSAIAAGIEVPKEQLVFHFVGRDKTGKSKAYGDVQDKQSGKRYYVNIDWVDNEGWKPVLVQPLN
ncbi:FMN-dependent NADH-azoreductase [Bacillus thuringiensis]|uniref:YrrS family protein n=1 Tax=Bacillus thuringiensis TaxID=1428 RepID=UPI000BFE1047|nr:YrrS family protein [Bacillus thuringiensis]PGR82105.1 FMN-dependent NADH-azoreductase [Bacillus thuringiensis]